MFAIVICLVLLMCTSMTWDVLDEKERTIVVIKGYVEVNDGVENETMKYLGEVWTERQKNERNRVYVIP